MSRHSTLAPLLVLALGAAVGGCMAEEPTTNQYGTVPDKNLPDFSTVPDMAPAGPLAPPVLAGLPQTSQYTSYPLKGTATPGDTVLIDGTAVGSVSVEVDQTGKFCALVELTPNAITTMTLVTVDPDGNMSAPITFAVTESGTQDNQQQQGTPSVNAALTGTGSSSMVFDDGDESLMHDGDPTTYADARWETATGDAQWFLLTLPSPQVIKEIEVLATSACPLTAAFQLYTSDTAPTTSPGPGAQGWTLATPAPKATDSTDVTWTANYATPPTVQTIAVYFDPGHFPTGTDDNCGSSWVELGPLYAIAEIQAWTVATVAPPPVGAPSCGD